MEKYYDKKNNRLVFIGKKANQNFWSNHWKQYDIKQILNKNKYNRFVINNTKKYLPKPGSKILEGGCGLSQNVCILTENGYDAYGIDFDKRTIGIVKSYLPKLKILCGDVRSLPFRDNFFDGYWSLGVIEHFYDGFEDIVSEIQRVVRPSGYLYLTFPSISKIRENKIKEKKYPIWENKDKKIKEFYQFALPNDSVLQTLKKYNFKLVKKIQQSGLKGFKDETNSKAVKKVLQQVYDSDLLVARAISHVIDRFLSPLTGHVQFFILKSTKNK